MLKAIRRTGAPGIYYAPYLVAMLSIQTRPGLNSWIRHAVGRSTGSNTPAGQNSWMKIIRQGHRVIQKPLMPVCTFGYAVTRVGGKKNNFLRRAHFTLTPSVSLLPVPTRRNCPNPRRQQRTKCKPQEVEGIRTKFKSSGYRGKPSVAAASGELSPQPSKS